MSDLTRALRNVCWFAAVCLMTALSPVWASDAVAADFDGDDGLRDRTSVQRHPPSVLHIWLSTMPALSRLDAQRPVLSLTGRDLDGDPREDVIAGASSDLGWTTHRRGLEPPHPRHLASFAIPRPAGHAVDDGGEIPPEAVPPVGPWLIMPLRPTRPPSPSCVSSGLYCPDDAVAVADCHVAPFAPRPPPLDR